MVRCKTSDQCRDPALNPFYLEKRHCNPKTSRCVSSRAAARPRASAATAEPGSALVAGTERRAAAAQASQAAAKRLSRISELSHRPIVDWDAIQQQLAELDALTAAPGLAPLKREQIQSRLAKLKHVVPRIRQQSQRGTFAPLQEARGGLRHVPTQSLRGERRTRGKNAEQVEREQRELSALLAQTASRRPRRPREESELSALLAGRPFERQSIDEVEQLLNELDALVLDNPSNKALLSEARQSLSESAALGTAEQDVDQLLAELDQLVIEGAREPSWREEADFWNRFEPVKVLGSGSYGTVLRVKRKQDGAEFALKLLHQVDAETLQEIAVLRLVTALCPQLMRYYGAFRIPPSPDHLNERVFGVLMELVPGQTLFAYTSGLIDRGRSVEPRLAREWLRQLAEQLDCLHRANVLHADIKPENTVVTNASDPQAKLIDFGLACTTAQQPIDRCRGWRGTRLYVAPEWYNASITNFPAADIFALGLSWLELMLAPNAYEDVLELLTNDQFDSKKVLQNAQMLNQWAASANFYPADPQLEQLVRRMISVDPAKRPTARQIVQELS